ncbi:hypothetical protein DWU99_01080 [Dyella psychrodurans]|uniref:Uncharacterized protein n=1 Tax=Dyella psychrodurans TaxID=1927960 RepID=A0A370XCA5_9GAMM|nr:hypothetical protein DWU99_01080 [Dyella psychrodurans]
MWLNGDADLFERYDFAVVRGAPTVSGTVEAVLSGMIVVVALNDGTSVTFLPRQILLRHEDGGYRRRGGEWLGDYGVAVGATVSLIHAPWCPSKNRLMLERSAPRVAPSDPHPSPSPEPLPVLSERDKALGWVNMFGMLPMPPAPQRKTESMVALNALMDEWRRDDHNGGAADGCIDGAHGGSGRAAKVVEPPPTEDTPVTARKVFNALTGGACIGWAAAMALEVSTNTNHLIMLVGAGVAVALTVWPTTPLSSPRVMGGR